MTHKELRNVRSLRQLDKAHVQVLQDLNHSRNALGKDLRSLHRVFKPGNLFNSGWRIMAPTTPTPGQLLLGLVRRLKARLRVM